MSIMNILSQFKSNNTQTVLPADNKTKLQLYVKIYTTLKSGYGESFLSKLLNVDEANGAVELATNHLNEMTPEQINEVVHQCEAMFDAAEKNLVSKLFEGFIKNPQASVNELVCSINEPEQETPEQDQPEQYQPEQYQPEQYQPEQDQPEQYQPEQDQPEQPMPEINPDVFARALLGLLFGRR